MAARLLTLASGRVPLGPRLLVWASLGLLLGAWVVLDPGHRAAPRLTPAPPATLLLPPRSPWVERAELADPAGLFLRPPTLAAGVPVTAQPEAMPFLAFGPDLRNQPGQALAPLPSAAQSPISQPIQLLLQPEAFPLRTLGQSVQALPPTPRRVTAEIYSDSGELSLRWELEAGSHAKKIHKLLSEKELKSLSPVEFRMGLDDFGLQAPPFLSLSSGDSALDQAVGEWVRGQPWPHRLPPGSYRLRVGP